MSSRAKRNNKQPSAIIQLFTQMGDVAKAHLPGQCFLANCGRRSSLGACRVTAKDVRGTLLEDHLLVQNGQFEAGTRFVAPACNLFATDGRALSYYIANVDSSLKAGDLMVATEAVTFEIDLLAPDVKIIPPSKVGPKGGVRGDRSEETRRSEAQPQRAAQKRNAAQTYALSMKNAHRVRQGQGPLRGELADAYVASL